MYEHKCKKNYIETNKKFDHNIKEKEFFITFLLKNNGDLIYNSSCKNHYIVLFFNKELYNVKTQQIEKCITFDVATSVK
jgi:hypothetical protein